MAEDQLRSDPEVYGFYRTSEGRSFLRSVYRRWLDRNRDELGADGFKDTKMASMVAKEAPNDQRREDRLTRAALRRWASDKNTQTELWRDLRKTELVLSRLEEQLMLEDDLAEVLEDRAAGIRRLDTANALATFFYGPSYRGRKFDRWADVNAMSGVFSIHPIRGGELSYSRQLEGGLTFWKLEPHQLHPILVFQEATLQAERGRNVFQKRKAGFLFVGPGGSLIRFVVSHIDPQIRWVELYTKMDSQYSRSIYSPDEGDPDHDEMSDNVYHSAVIPFDERFSLQTREEAISISEGIYINREKSDLTRFVDRSFSGNMWDIPL